MDLTAAVDVIRAPLGEILPRVSAALSEAIAHRAVAELSGNCPHSPFKTHGDPPGGPGTAITTAEMAALAPMARAEEPGRAGRGWPGPRYPCSPCTATPPRGARCWSSYGPRRPASRPRPWRPPVPCGTW
ncbi:hypothetical protein ACFQ10_05760 [Streptomyces indonesiensis]